MLVVKVATVVVRGWSSCDGEGAACICAREVGVVMGLMNGKKEKERKITHLSWRVAGPIYACDVCEDRCNEVAGMLAKGGVMCHDPDASDHGTCTTTVCSLISTLFVCPLCSAFGCASPQLSYLR